MDKLDKTYLACKSEAEEIHASLENNVGSIITIIMIISVVISIIRLLQSCQKPTSELRGSFKEHIGRNRLKKIVYGELGSHLYREHGEAVMAAIDKRSEQVADAAIDEMIRGIS